MPPEVIVTRGLPSSVVSQLERAATVEVYTGEGAIPPEELRGRIASAAALISMVSDSIDRGVIDAAPTLKDRRKRRGRLQ